MKNKNLTRTLSRWDKIAQKRLIHGGKERFCVLLIEKKKLGTAQERGHTTTTPYLRSFGRETVTTPPPALIASF